MSDAVPFEEKQLDDHSKAFAQALFSVRPSWREFARVEKSSYGDQLILVVTVDPPESSKADHPLIIDSDNDEITIGFDVYHAHFNWPDLGYGDPFQFIEDVVEERIAVVSLWAGEKWVLSTTLDVTSGEAALAHVPEGATFKKIRSWNGTYSGNESLL